MSDAVRAPSPWVAIGLSAVLAAGGYVFAAGAANNQIATLRADLTDMKATLATERGERTGSVRETDNRISRIGDQVALLTAGLARLSGEAAANATAQERFNTNMTGWYRSMQEQLNRGVRPQSGAPWMGPEFDVTGLVPWMPAPPEVALDVLPPPRRVRQARAP